MAPIARCYSIALLSYISVRVLRQYKKPKALEEAEEHGPMARCQEHAGGGKVMEGCMVNVEGFAMICYMRLMSVHENMDR